MLHGIARLIRKIFLNLSESKWIPSSYRYHLVKMGGVNIKEACFIGSEVLFDTICPNYITIEKDCTITSRVVILSHFRKGGQQYKGRVSIGKHSFLGCGCIITSPISIGDSAIVGAGSIVTKDIPAGEIWAGNPARFIRKREDVDNYISKKK